MPGHQDDRIIVIYIIIIVLLYCLINIIYLPLFFQL